jgi:hypothetical protein
MVLLTPKLGGYSRRHSRLGLTLVQLQGTHRTLVHVTAMARETITYACTSPIKNAKVAKTIERYLIRKDLRHQAVHWMLINGNVQVAETSPEPGADAH